MNKYVCSICGYIYDEAEGRPDAGIAPGTAWDSLPESWLCPVCGASKEDFYPLVEEQPKAPAAQPQEPSRVEPTAEGSPADLVSSGSPWSTGALGAIFSNLAKGCEKQYLPTPAEQFQRLANYYLNKPVPTMPGKIGEQETFANLQTALETDLATGYAGASAIAHVKPDRGALRALVWGEKVSKMQTAILGRYDKQREETLQGTNLYVCEICGFLYIGDEPPEICPVCKVPSLKIRKVG